MAGDLEELNSPAAQARESHGPADEALLAGERAVVAAPGDAEQQAHLGQLLLDENRHEEAVAAFLRAIALQPRIVRYYDLLATAREKQNRLDAAIRAARHAADLEPQDAGRRGRVGQLLLYAGRHAEAEVTLRQAVELAAGVTAFHHMLGIALDRQGRWPEAIVEARRVAELVPDNAELNDRLAAMLMHEGAFGEAETILRRAIELQPTAANLHRSLCTALERQSRPDAAVEVGRQLVDLQPDHAWHRNHLAVLLLRLRRPDDAEAVLTEALARHPTMAALYDTLSQALAQQKRIEDAVAVLRGAADLPDAYADLHARLADLLDSIDDLAGAELSLRRAVAADPDSAILHNRLTRLVERRRYIEMVPFEEEEGRAGTPREVLHTPLANTLAEAPRAAVLHDMVRSERMSAIPLDVAANDYDGISAAVSKLTGLTAHELVMQYESLGENCEFGFVQRVCGAEPLGLLRFAGMGLPRVTRALLAGFAGLSDPGNLFVEGKGRWDIKDRTYRLTYHTFLNCNRLTAEQVLRDHTKRVEFLRRKLLDDLAEGDKTFVVWRRQPFTELEVLPLLDALRQRGPASLLYMVPTEPAGMVEIVRPGLMCGHIDRLAPHGAVSMPSLAGWLTVLVNAWALLH